LLLLLLLLLLLPPPLLPLPPLQPAAVTQIADTAVNVSAVRRENDTEDPRPVKTLRLTYIPARRTGHVAARRTVTDS
jgi:hypothetical protein